MTTQPSGSAAPRARSRIPADVLGLRIKPDCGHDRLVDCPLNERDWEEVYRAWSALRAVCVSVAVAAHERVNRVPERDAILGQDATSDA